MRIGQLWANYMAGDLAPEEARLAQAYTPARAAFVNDGLMAVLTAVRNGDLEAARRIHNDKLEPLAQTAIGLSDQLTRHQIDVAAQEFKLSQQLETIVEVAMICATGLALLMGVGLAIAITRSITRPINEAVKVATTVAAGINIKITSTIPVASGLGSGAAVTVALTRALSSHINYAMTDEQVNAFASEIEKLHHGTPSGIDNTVITYAKSVYFVKGLAIETFKVSQPFTIVIGDTGIRAPTKESVGDVRKLWEADKVKWEGVFDEVGVIAKEARKTLESDSLLSNALGNLMNQNHTLLQELTVSSPELDRLVSAARNAGALGAKLSGGGRGGNMIALVEPSQAEAIAQSLMEAGAKNTIITQVS